MEAGDTTPECYHCGTDGDDHDPCCPLWSNVPRPVADTTPQVVRLGGTRCAGATVVEIDGGPSGTWCEITWTDDPYDMPTTVHPDERHGRDALPRAIALAAMVADRITVLPNLELSGFGR